MTHTYGTSLLVGTADGRSLHVMESGSGIVTVVLESGLGMSRSTWGLVAPALAADHRVVVYDRAGLGWSDPDPAGRSLDRLAADLVTVVRHVDVGGPMVLVGHSWGGPIVRTAASHLGADTVRGIVLVDQVDEHADLYFSDASRKRFDLSVRMARGMARLGLYRPIGSRPGRVQPDDVAADHRREDFSRAAVDGMAAEMETFLDDLARLRDEPLDLLGIPVVVISGTRPVKADRAVRDAVTAAHRVTAETTPNARLVEATGSAHLVMFDEPAVVIEAVRSLVG